MPPRLKYAQLAPEGFAKLTALEHYLNAETGLDHSLLGLVRLRCSSMNGCEYCIHLHTAELKKLNETPDRIAALTDWRSSEFYTHRERAAIAWAEAITDIQDGHAIYDEVLVHFSEAETVNLTLAITTSTPGTVSPFRLATSPAHADSVVCDKVEGYG